MIPCTRACSRSISIPLSISSSSTCTTNGTNDDARVALINVRKSMLSSQADEQSSARQRALYTEELRRGQRLGD